MPRCGSNGTERAKPDLGPAAGTAHYKLSDPAPCCLRVPAPRPLPHSVKPPRSKSLATWLAVIGGTLGLHRFYLYGWRDLPGWLYPLPTLLGLAGVQRMRAFGQDDLAASLLIPLLGLSVSAAMLTAIVYGLTPDDKWAQRHGAGAAPQPTGWAPVLGVIVALLVGATALMGTIAFGGQRFFEWQLGQAAGQR